MGFRYGSLVEDYYTGLRLHCQGWRSIYCNPERPAFLAEMPIALNDVVTQMKRWAVGLLEVAISKYSPLTFGTRYMGSLMAHCYCYYAFGPILSFPIMVYSFLPQITFLNSIYIFPSVSNLSLVTTYTCSFFELEFHTRSEPSFENEERAF